ncbi:MAG: fatty-acid synthase [Candidatus Electrothrix sp. MAN1_4]|nr:fatty-acid synthase [Candidatus Electrothrix sp. MAN1_4]
MPQRDASHDIVKKALAKNGWKITDDPYVISYGERFLFVDLGAEEIAALRFIGATRENERIAVEIKEFRSKSVMLDLEQAVGQYTLYRLLLGKVDPERMIYLATTDVIFDEIFREPVGELVIQELPMRLIVIDSAKEEVKKWIIPSNSEK